MGVRRGAAAVALAVVGWGGPARAGEPFEARVVRVHDGDTITVLRDGKKQVRIRLEGVDCPELRQDFGRRAKRFTSEKAAGQLARILPKEWDRYGRLVARVLVGGEDLSHALVRAGLAWHFKRYSSDRRLADEERVARDAKVGLWSQPNPTPPWDWRRVHRSSRRGR